MRHDLEIVRQSLEQIKREFVHLSRQKISSGVRQHLVAMWDQYRTIYDEIVTIQKMLDNPFLYPEAPGEDDGSIDTAGLGIELKLGDEPLSESEEKTDQPAAKIVRLPAKPMPESDKPRVLIVDDCENTQNILDFTLSKQGYAIESLTDPTFTMERVTKNRPDLILLDLMMPQMDGFEVLKLLRGNPDCDDIQIIVGSSRSYDKDRLTVLGLGANDFIAKPYNVKELGLRIRNFVGTSPSGRPLPTRRKA